MTLLDPTYASRFVPIIASVSEHQPTQVLHRHAASNGMPSAWGPSAGKHSGCTVGQTIVHSRGHPAHGARCQLQDET